MQREIETVQQTKSWEDIRAESAHIIGKVLYNHMGHSEENLRVIANSFYPYGGQRGRVEFIWRHELDRQLALMFPPKPTPIPEDPRQTKLFEEV